MIFGCHLLIIIFFAVVASHEGIKVTIYTGCDRVAPATTETKHLCGVNTYRRI